MFKDKRVLVCGGAGFVGANLIERLLQQGARVRATLHRKPAAIEDKRIEYVTCDLTKQEECYRAVDRSQYVFMCAANTSGAAVMETEPLVHVTPNVAMNTWMLDAAYKAGVEKFLFITLSQNK